MQIIHSIHQLKQWRNNQTSVALVPTMGNLHEGHLALIREAKKHADAVVVSIFVNRLQFVQGEDFEQYPRTLEADAAKLADMGVAIIFAPDERELYPHMVQNYYIEPSNLQHDLCGKYRPGHFRGVATVVTKLFNIVQPDVACFGKKDYQQLIIIRNMVADLNIPVTIVLVDIVRSHDGLALSSRNAYLTPEERMHAPELYRVLADVRQKIQQGARNYSELEQAASHRLQQMGWMVDYITVRHADTLTQANKNDVDVVILAAARLGKTRLIDNLEVHLLPEH